VIGDRFSTLFRSLGVKEALLILLIALVPRCAGVGKTPTIDELTWIARSNSFAKTMLYRDWMGTQISQHPGQTIMWIGAASIAPRILFDFLRERQPDQSLEVFMERYRLVDFMEEVQLGMSICCSVLIAASVWLFARLTDRRYALAVGILMAMEPILVGFSRLLHMDMLMSMLLLCSFLCLLECARRSSIFWPIASGIFGGLAILTKIPAICIVGFMGLTCVYIVVVNMKRVGSLSWSTFIPSVRIFIAWCMACYGIIDILWPAFFLHPIGVIKWILEGVFWGLETPHSIGSFFLGQNVERVSSLYIPVGLLTILSPLTFLLALPGAGILISKLWHGKTRWWPVALASVMGFLFTGMMIMGAMKAVRYCLPAILSLELLAGVCVYHLLFSCSGRLGKALVGAAFLFAFFLSLWWFPYEITFVTPFVQGRSVMDDIIPRGWGEGLREAGQYLNSKPNATEMRVASWYDGLMAGYFDGEVTSLSEAMNEDIDYVLLYANQIQRNLHEKVLKTYRSRSPEKVIAIKGRDMVWIYKVH